MGILSIFKGGGLKSLRGIRHKGNRVSQILAAHDRFVRGQGDGVRADLAVANLSRVNFQGADLAYANLEGANLYGAKLASADLSKARLCRTDLRKVDLTEANLGGADLTEAQAGAQSFSAQTCAPPFFVKRILEE